MSESVRPSSSQTAISIAFKKARRKFPKNFGLTPKRVEKENSENEDSSSCRDEQELTTIIPSPDPINDKIDQKSIPEVVETGLIDSFKEVKLSEESKILCNHCEDQSENTVSVDFKLDLPVVNDHEKFENVYFQKQEFADNYGYENELPTKPDPSNFTYHETRHNIGLIWNGESDHCDNFADSEMDETPRPRKYEETPTRKRRQSHRRKNSSHHCHSDYIYEDESFECITSCMCHEHYAHCQHYYRHCSCCRAHYCCCTRCCLIWQERAIIAREACPNCNRRRRSKKKRCSTCNGKRRSSSSSIPCSRDSGIFTQTRSYEDYDDDDEDASATLMHKDSLSILQEKYAKKNCRRRDEDDEERAKGRKTCKRISNRYSYY